ncbi:H-type lectin domain-containing protein [Streptomyces sp. TRM64462]|uniref:H-type lectin domain-containing protein n=1 Tax=Streptomyces sp. TRM64462 TaxID=2741726 RepID=UPI001C2F7689|nr:H-type lectin domain-containing protein [Streptomyces sp. TRM64462]
MTVRVGRLTNGMTPEDHRLAASVGMAPTGPLTTRGGCIPGGLDLAGSSAMQATLQPGRLWIQGANAAPQGGYAVTVDAEELLTFSDGDATYARIDAVVVRVRDDVYDGSQLLEGRVEIVEGTPAADPVAPVSPANSEKLYEVTVPAGASAGTGGIDWGTAVAERRRYTAALGGIVPPGWASGFSGGYTGQYRDVNGVLQRWSGTEWEPILRLGDTGQLQLGDATWYRHSGPTMATDAIIRAYRAPTSNAFSVRTPGETNSRMFINGDGSIFWGPGGTEGADTKLYRDAPNTLKTDDDLIVRTHKAHYGESGVVPITFSNSTSFTWTFSFNTPFATAPKVFANINSGAGATAGWNVRVISISTTGCTLFGFGSSSSWSNVPVAWAAFAS